METILTKQITEVVAKEVFTALQAITQVRDNLCDYLQDVTDSALSEIGYEGVEELNAAICYLADYCGKELTQKLLY